MMSVPLPGVNGTTILTGFVGQACASTPACTAHSASAAIDLPSFPDILSSRADDAKARGSIRAPNRLPRSPCGHHPDIADENTLIGAVGVDHPNFGGSASVGVEQQLRAVR